ncbi:MAG: radical SAM protein [Tenericutes bacterium HGW-Tenericutes-4]|nr:MAG: radical SAM protein [Tenericutes bacterium HGW-Tenericutes-4]
MIIQSLSVVVPNKACMNACKFCVSRMRVDDYKNNLQENSEDYELYIEDYKKRLEFARDNGCNTVILTGISEPQQNKKFLSLFAKLNGELPSVFKRVEMQTTGTLLNLDYLKFLRQVVGITTIALSISSFKNEENIEIIGMREKLNLEELCKNIKDQGFNLRLSVNLSKVFDTYTPEQFMKECENLKVDQLTLRVLYESGESNLPQNKWIQENKIRDSFLEEFKAYIKTYGRPLELMEFGQMRYSLKNISLVIDDDCMSLQVKDTLKYLILREDCKLYTKWDDKGSLLF